MPSDPDTVQRPSDDTGDNPPPVPPDERLARALEAASRAASTRVEQSPPEELRDAVFDFVARARAQGLYPESVLVSLKEHAQRSGVSRLDRAAADAIVAQIVRWAIEEYYRDQ